jgi:histidine decarboxylase
MPAAQGARPGSLSAADQRRLDELFARFERERPLTVGYPVNQCYDYSPLFRVLEFSANNIGDPFRGSNVPLNTHAFEQEVVLELAELTRAPAGEVWGYVTNGGTEGNMYGLYLARELHPDGIVYFSEDSHYSVPKILRLQHTRNIMIKSRATGEIDLDDLRATLRIHRDVPPILFVNAGTTMKGAIDDLAAIRELLADLAISSAYLHVDAALSGGILPFVDDPPAWDFADGADSIAVSGHKLLGSPIPCGIVLARRSHVERVARSIEYVGALDTTISGSRSAVTPLFLWYRLRTLGRDGVRAVVRRSLEVAEAAVGLFAERGIEAWRHEHSVTVVFPRPAPEVMARWALAPRGDIAHLITLPPVDEAVVREFVADYCAARER